MFRGIANYEQNNLEDAFRDFTLIEEEPLHCSFHRLSGCYRGVGFNSLVERETG